MAVPGWLRDKKVWAFAGAGGGLGLLVYLQRRRQQQGPVDAATGQVANPATFDDAGINAYQNLQNEFESLQANVAGQLAGLEGRLDALPDAQQGVSPSAPARHAYQLHRIGRLGQSYNLREVAARYAPNPSSPGSVEAMLRRIVRANPKLHGRTSVPGGFPLKVPT